MRRGRILIYSAIAMAAVTCGLATAARADNGGAGSPSAICADLQDGKLDGTYTQDQWNAFLSDPTVQGYCSVVVPPCVYPGSSGGSGSGGTTACSPTTPTTPRRPTTPSTPSTTPPVPLTPQQPAAVAAVKGARHTVVHTPTTGVRGAQHTVKVPVSKSSVAPVSIAKTRGTLPFTGAQLALFTLVGLALLAAGLLLRLTGRPSRRS